MTRQATRPAEGSPRQRTPLLGLPEPTSPEQAFRTGRTPRVMNPERNETTVDGERTSWVPALVQAGLQRCSDQRLVASQMPRISAVEWAARADRLARIADREARWWSVLARWTYSQPYRLDGVPLIFGRAVLKTIEEREQRAHLLRQMAKDWRHRAAGRPVCPVIGCDCGGTGECGVAA